MTDLAGLNPEDLRAVVPGAVTAYLQSQNWEPEASANNTLWSIDDGTVSAQLLIPATNRMRGYVGFIQDALRTLSEIEGRSVSQILFQILSTERDTQYVRTMPDSEPGTTTLLDGATAFDSLRLWVQAGATIADGGTGRAVQPRRKSARVSEFLKSVRLGPTFAGSYVLTAQIPVPRYSANAQLELDHPEIKARSVPFERSVSLALQAATFAAYYASARAVERADLESFYDSVSNGVSANLCESLIGFSGERGNEFSVSFAWASSHPQRSVEPILFTRNQIAALKEGAAMLREREPEEGVRIIGSVVRLHREGNFGPGEISILGIIEGDTSDKFHRIWAHLAEDDYRAAWRAHEAGALISVLGNLVHRGNRFVLEGVRDFLEVSPIGNSGEGWAYGY